MKSLRSLFAITLGLVSLAFAQPITAEQKAKVLSGISDVVTKRAFVPGVDFTKWDGFVTARKEKIDAAETIPSFTREVNTALREFGFSHIVLQSPRAAATRNRTSTIGMGVQLTQTPEGARIQSVRDGSPAKEAGLEVGEMIVTINGKPARDWNNEEAKEGDVLKLEVKNKEGVVRTLDLTLKRISLVRPETLTWPREDTAVLRVWTFSAGYGRQNIEKLMGEAAKAKHLILDLRGNGGGAVNNLNHLLSLLMPDQTDYGVFISRSVFDSYVRANPEKPTSLDAIAAWAPNRVRTRARQAVAPFTGRIAVLTNRGSGSASEIAAASLQEQVKAIVVGQRTAGAVLASVFGPVGEGFALQYPVSDYLTAKGRRLEGNPLLPDHEVTELATGEKDPTLEKALELLVSTPR